MDKLPVSFDFETTQILKRLITAHRELALLNGICDSMHCRKQKTALK